MAANLSNFVPEDTDQNDLVKRINAAHAIAVDAFKTATEAAVKCGELLIEAKMEIRHGEWEAWVEKNCAFGRRSANGYMRLAK